MKTLILDEKDPKNVIKLFLNMSPHVDILGFHLEVSFMLHLIQLRLRKH